MLAGLRGGPLIFIKRMVPVATFQRWFLATREEAGVAASPRSRGVTASTAPGLICRKRVGIPRPLAAA